MKKDRADVIVVDGMNVMWRAGHSMKALGTQDSKGWIETGAVYGFLDMVLSVVRRNLGATVMVAWEGGRESRREIMPEYKAHRDEPDEHVMEMWESIATQREILKKILKVTSWGQSVAKGYEADDVMATIARRASAIGLNVLIQSNDSDMLQCLRDAGEHEDPSVHAGWIHMWRTAKGENSPLWTPDRLLEEKGVRPDQWSAVKALGGDTSDGYSGAKGVGETWACRFMAEHGTFVRVLTAARQGDLTPAKSKAIAEAEEYVRTCYKVAQVNDRCDLITQWGTAKKRKLKDIFTQLRFHSLVSNTALRRLTA